MPDTPSLMLIAAWLPLAASVATLAGVADCEIVWPAGRLAIAELTTNKGFVGQYWAKSPLSCQVTVPSVVAPPVSFQAGCVGPLVPAVETTDRKSTRLNSSHLGIS